MTPINIPCTAWGSMHHAVMDVGRFHSDFVHELPQWDFQRQVSLSSRTEDKHGKARYLGGVEHARADESHTRHALRRVVPLESGVEE